MSQADAIGLVGMVVLAGTVFFVIMHFRDRD
jgi:hypothetical protein